MEAIKQRTATKKLPCQLTEDEVRLRGIALADAAKEHIDLQDAKKESAKEFKDKIDRVNAVICDLKDVVRNAVEVRDVDVEYRYDNYLGNVTVTRKDTGEVVEKRMMTPKESQGELFDTEA